MDVDNGGLDIYNCAKYLLYRKIMVNENQNIHIVYLKTF
jgi:hypothetical protein